MEINLTDSFLNCLMISMIVSVVVRALIEKFKTIDFLKNNNHIFLLNLIFSFVIGINFSIIFYNMNINEGIWISIFSFIGAPSIYDGIKKIKNNKNNT